MASKRQIKYRIVLRNKRGVRTTPRYAVSYEIFYGKRKILAEKAFHPRTKTTDQKKRYLDKSLRQIEELRLEALEKQRKTREKKRKERAKELERQQKETKKQLEKAQKKLQERRAKRATEEAEKEPSVISDQEVFDILDPIKTRIEKESANFSKTKSEDPTALPNATIESVLVTPFSPKGDTYTKELIEKIITTQRRAFELYLTILNFNLKQPYYLPLTRKNFDYEAAVVYYNFISHILNFYESIDDEYFIFRIKYRKRFEGGKWYDFGISKGRNRVTSLDRMKELVKETIYLFQNKMTDGKNYLMGDVEIEVTGFSLEAASEV